MGFRQLPKNRDDHTGNFVLTPAVSIDANDSASFWLGCRFCPR